MSRASQAVAAREQRVRPIEEMLQPGQGQRGRRQLQLEVSERFVRICLEMADFS
jgi:hypothetical protein